MPSDETRMHPPLVRRRTRGEARTLLAASQPDFRLPVGVKGLQVHTQYDEYERKTLGQKIGARRPTEAELDDLSFEAYKLDVMVPHLVRPGGQMDVFYFVESPQCVLQARLEIGVIAKTPAHVLAICRKWGATRRSSGMNGNTARRSGGRPHLSGGGKTYMRPVVISTRVTY